MPDFEQFTHVRATWDDDPAQREPFLVCEACGEKLCTVEEGDSFEVLAHTVSGHINTCTESRRTDA